MRLSPDSFDLDIFRQIVLGERVEAPPVDGVEVPGVGCQVAPVDFTPVGRRPSDRQIVGQLVLRQQRELGERDVGQSPADVLRDCWMRAPRCRAACRPPNTLHALVMFPAALSSMPRTRYLPLKAIAGLMTGSGLASSLWRACCSCARDPRRSGRSPRSPRAACRTAPTWCRPRRCAPPVEARQRVLS